MMEVEELKIMMGSNANGSSTLCSTFIERQSAVSIS